MNDDRPGTMRALLAILVLVSVIAALHATRAVTLPVALAIFIVILAWPVQRWLEHKRVPRSLAYCLTLFAVLLVFSFFVGLLYLCVQNVAAKAPEYEERFAAIYEQAKAWAEANGLIGSPAEGDEGGSFEATLQALRVTLVWSYGMIGLFTLTVTFLVLGLIEVHRFRNKLDQSAHSPLAGKLRKTGEDVGKALQRYMLARTLVSAATGILVGLFTWIVGLDFPLVWGVSSFLLNYIPVLGSIVAVIPPSLFALLHPEWWYFFVVLSGLTLIQFTIGNLIDPHIEGRILALSPFVLFFSIVFWGWVWGIPGALIGIPLTATIVIVCQKFEPTRGLAVLLMK